MSSLPTFTRTWEPEASGGQLVDRIFMISERMMIFDGLDDVFTHIVTTAATLTNADAATIRVFDVESGTLNIAKAYGVTDGFLSQPAVRVGEGITGRVVQTGMPFTSANIQADANVKNPEFARLENIRSLLCVPMNTRETTIGCITVYRKTPHPFGDHDLLLLSIFASKMVEAVEKSRLINELKQQACHDSLTGFLNKRAVLETLNVETARAVRHGQPLSVIFIDLDNFKTFNDQHGHLLGDKMLHDFSRVLREHCRRIDVIGRFGGDEFVIVAPQTDSKGALALADKIQHAVTNFPFVSSIADASVHTTCSIGIASLPQDSKRADELLNNADQALYASKRRGKGCTSAWIKPAQTA